MRHDPQAKLVYAWEDFHIAPIHNRLIAFDHAQKFVDGVFLAMGLLYPPQVEPMPKQNRTREADANRIIVRLKEQAQAWVIVHELAHVMTNTAHESTEGHGPDFMGMYLKLLDKVLGIPLAYTMFTLKDSGIKYNLAVSPKFAKSGF